MSIPAEVLLTNHLSHLEAAELVEALEDVGLTADLREVAPRRALGEVAWLALALLPLKPFFEKLATDFAADAYQRLKAFAQKILHLNEAQPSQPPKVLLLQDSTSGIQVVIEPDLPARAYQQLLSFDFATLHRGPLHYDQHYRRWRSELDELEKQ